jgi:hypothetical protein
MIQKKIVEEIITKYYQDKCQIKKYICSLIINKNILKEINMSLMIINNHINLIK